MSLWFQKIIKLKPRTQGCYLVTDEILSEIGPDLKQIEMGLCNILLMHTSAGLILMENCDPTVRVDLNNYLNKIAPEGKNLYQHDDEGPDDMPGHIKCALTGVSLNIPISKGQLLLGTWQGIYLMEYRAHKQNRQVVVTLNGQKFTN